MSFPRPGAWSSHAVDRLPSLRRLKETISNLPVAVDAKPGCSGGRQTFFQFNLSRDGEAASRQAHNLKTAGSTPAPAIFEQLPGAGSRPTASVSAPTLAPGMDAERRAA